MLAFYFLIETDFLHTRSYFLPANQSKCGLTHIANQNSCDLTAVSILSSKQSYWSTNASACTIVIIFKKLIENSDFQLSVKSISELLWFCITSLSDWFKVFAPFFRPTRSETKSNRSLRVHVFPRFVLATCNYFDLWLVYWIVSVLFDWPKELFCFGFTTIDGNSL